MLRKFVAESFRNFGIGLMVASIVLMLSEKISEKELLVVFLTGLANVLVGVILIKGVKDD